METFVSKYLSFLLPDNQLQVFERHLKFVIFKENSNLTFFANDNLLNSFLSYCLDIFFLKSHHKNCSKCLEMSLGRFFYSDTIFVKGQQNHHFRLIKSNQKVIKK